MVARVSQGLSGGEGEEVPPPPRKRKQRSDTDQPRHNVSKLRVYTSSTNVKIRQIRINGKWHGLSEVCC